MSRFPLNLLLGAAATVAVCSGASRPVAAHAVAPVSTAAAAVASSKAALTASLPSATLPSVAMRSAAVPAPAEHDPAVALLAALHAAAPAIDAGVLALALEARACAVRGGTATGPNLAVIDYSLPSTQKRMWVFDVERQRLLYAEHVAHGRGSGENHARAFSNRDGSHQTSLGLFSTAETYVGGNGYSLRMDGLEPGVNDNARDRLIVIHGANYVNPQQALAQGRLGRSFGCPALRPQVAREVIDTLKGQQLLFAFYPDADWLTGSRYFGCGGRTAGEILAAARGTPASGTVARANAGGGSAHPVTAAR